MNTLTTTIQTISNAGVRIEMDGLSILIDPFNSPDHPPYRGISCSVWERELSRGADILLYTHLHDDHYDTDMTVRFMKKHPKALLIIPKEARDSLADKHIDFRQIRFLEDTSAVFSFPGGLKMTAFKTRHIGIAPGEISHYSWLIHGSRIILNTGDATPVYSNFRKWIPDRIDLIVCIFPFVLNPSARRLLHDIFHSNHTMLVHLPDPSFDGGQLNHKIQNTVDVLNDASVFIPTDNDTVYKF